MDSERLERAGICIRLTRRDLARVERLGKHLDITGTAAVRACTRLGLAVFESAHAGKGSDRQRAIYDRFARKVGQSS